MNVKRATVHPRATENIPEIISIVEALIERGYAYALNGDVYFEVRKFAPYGELSSRNIDELESGARVEVSEGKRDPLDFALWKAAKPGEPSWESPWGDGTAGLAHRMLGDVHQIPRAGVRYSRRRAGSHLSAP